LQQVVAKANDKGKQRQHLVMCQMQVANLQMRSRANSLTMAPQLSVLMGSGGSARHAEPTQALPKLTMWRSARNIFSSSPAASHPRCLWHAALFIFGFNTIPAQR
jgi:hypothetical protein